MGLTERERLIMHMAQLSTCSSYGRLHRPLPQCVNIIVKNRCRQLDKQELDEILADVEEELLLSGTLYEENNIA